MERFYYPMILSKASLSYTYVRTEEESQYNLRMTSQNAFKRVDPQTLGVVSSPLKKKFSDPTRSVHNSFDAVTYMSVSFATPPRHEFEEGIRYHDLGSDNNSSRLTVVY